ncbi:hypothetical protein Y032_0208g2058 [Ancylostoma ceylanicum]|uniref:Uncharacterized protein n=1 Tax=Ancylostoma ceylanicum TaxID=53326 RepID=A0A016SLJ2_9BILA|nr:hypothetical protein Y032_0208g2058 [Ancylostoma ceylanicum]
MPEPEPNSHLVTRMFTFRRLISSVKNRERRSRRKHRHRKRVKQRELTDDELYELAEKERDRQGINELYAAVKCHGLSRNAVRRAKKRQNFYLTIKSFILYMQTICLMLASFMAVIIARYVKEDDQSYYYTTQVTIEIILLLIALVVILFENMAVRSLMVLLFLTALFLNVLTVTYYILFDELATGCMKLPGAFDTVVCLTTKLPAQHHTIYCALLLALLHLLAFIASMCLNYYYVGTLSHLVDVSRALGFKPCYTKSSRRKRRRSRRRRKGFGTEVERTASYKWKGNVQPGGVIIGSGMESMTDSVTLQAPTKEAVRRDSKKVRHVMVDAVRAKRKSGGVVVPARKKVSAERRALEKGGDPKPSSKPPDVSSNRPSVVTKCPPGVKSTKKKETSKKDDDSELESITFNSLIEMDKTGSPCSYISEKTEPRKKKKKS